MLKPLVLGTLAAMILGAGPVTAQDEGARRLVVTGSGEVSARPDVARISAGVVVRAEAAAAALADNSGAMSRVLDQLRAAGLAEADLQTSQFSVMPLYETPERGSQPPAPPQIVGYQVSNQVTARLRDLERLGEVLDALVRAGANSIGGPSLELADPQALLGHARDAAVADALAKAERYATAAGVELGEIMTIEEGPSQPAPRPMMRAQAMDSAVPIAPGEAELSASVTITFALR